MAKLAIIDFQRPLPHTVNENWIISLTDQLRDLNSVTVALQREYITISEVRALFDTDIEDHLCTAAYLSPSAAIFKFPGFEAALIKIQNKKASELSFNEEQTVCVLQNSCPVVQTDVSNELNLAGRTSKEFKFSEKSLESYIDTRFLVSVFFQRSKIFCRTTAYLPHQLLWKSRFSCALILTCGR